MDPDTLRDALDRWTDEGVMDESTAARIREFESADATPRNETAVSSTDDDGSIGETTDDDGEGLLGENRVVVALALMGGVLVAVGVAAFLIERWDSIPVAVRVALLVGVPVAAAAGGARLDETSPRTAHGLWLLAALFAGVSLFQLAELTAAVDRDAAEPWLVAAWTTVAFAIAAWTDSRPVGGVAAILGAATLVTATASDGIVPLLGFYGAAVYVAGLLAGGRNADPAIPRFAGTLRWVGGAFAVLAPVPVVASGSQLGAVSTGTVLVGVAAAVAAAVAVRRAGDDTDARYATVPAVVAPIAVVVAWTVAGNVGEFAGALVALGCLLGLVLALVVGAVGLREAAAPNVAALGFVLGVLAFLVGPVADAVSGSLALVAAGTVLLAAGLGAERGRRAVLARIR